MITNWETLSPTLFEKLCAAVLSGMDFKNIQWYGEAGGDKGRDIIAEKIDTPVPGVERRERWMIQCKRYTRATLSKSELKDLFDSALEHTIDNLLIITTSTISANLRDWLSGATKKYPFKTYVWEELDFRREVLKQKSALLDSMPELTADKEPLWMYPMNVNEVRFACNEFDGVEIVVSNVDSTEAAKVRASEFLRYLQANGHDWWE